MSSDEIIEVITEDIRTFKEEYPRSWGKLKKAIEKEINE